MIDFEYFFPILLMFFGAVSESIFNFRPSKFYYYFIVVWIILVAGFRYCVGPDWPGYYNGYNTAKGYIGNMSELSRNLNFEIGYVYLNWIIAKTGFQIWIFNLLFAGTSILLKSSSIIKYSKFYFLGLLMYYLPNYFFEDIIQIRQGFASAIGIFSVRYIIDKKLWKFLLCIFLAYQIHHSAAIFVAAYWIGNSKIDYTYIVIVVVATIILSPLDLSKGIRPIIDFLPLSGLKDGYNSYIETGYVSNLEYSFADVVKISFFVLTIFYNKICETYSTDNSYKVIRNLFVFSVFLYYFFHSQSIFAVRLSNYYTVYFYLLIPLVLYYVHIYDNKIFIILFLIFVIYFILFYFRFQNLNGSLFLDYTNYIYNKVNTLGGYIDIYDNQNPFK